MHIINRNNPEFADVPATLEGEVLIERIVDADDNVTGFLTAPLDFVRGLKGKSDSELAPMGWLNYKHIIDSLQEGVMQE